MKKSPEKSKIEQTLFTVISLVCYFGVGAAVGFFIVSFEKIVGALNGLTLFATFALAAAIVAVAFIVNVCIHETGHMIFGLLTGYKFNSLRLGNLILLKDNGKLRVSRFSIPGTLGQCIMSVPDVSPERMPVVIFNLGGLIMNIILLILSLVLYFVFKLSAPVFAAGSIIFSTVCISVLITNGLPFPSIGTDGANAIILHGDKNARSAFRNQMELMKYLSQNQKLENIPKDLFYFDKEIPITNPIVTSQAVNYFNFLNNTGCFTEAKEFGNYILENAKGINNLHSTLINGELMFIEAVIVKDVREAEKMYKAHEKEFKSASGFISVQRFLYAYYTLVEADEKKALLFKNMFEKSYKNYPYSSDAESEKSLFDLIAEADLLK